MQAKDFQITTIIGKLDTIDKDVNKFIEFKNGYYKELKDVRDDIFIKDTDVWTARKVYYIGFDVRTHLENLLHNKLKIEVVGHRVILICNSNKQYMFEVSKSFIPNDEEVYFYFNKSDLIEILNYMIYEIVEQNEIIDYLRDESNECFQIVKDVLIFKIKLSEGLL